MVNSAPFAVIRTDASHEIGTGHVVRCLALAAALAEARPDSRIAFLCRTLPGDLCDFIARQGYSIHQLNGDSDWRADAEEARDWIQEACDGSGCDLLVTDHYGLDYRWETALRPASRKILAIDDVADRRHECDVLLDQNYHRNQDERYAGLLPDNCRELLGPRYALLRPGFAAAREKLEPREGRLRSLLVFFGGADPTNETKNALTGLQPWILESRSHSVDVVVGGANPHREQIKSICAQMPNTAFHCQAENMPELMARADLAIGAGGSTSWERCCLGLPALAAVLGENQLELTQDLAEFGAVKNMGWDSELRPENYLAALRNLSTDELRRMSEKGLELVDGKGSARVARAIWGENL